MPFWVEKCFITALHEQFYSLSAPQLSDQSEEEPLLWCNEARGLLEATVQTE